MFPALLSATRRYGSDGSIQGHQCLVRPRTPSDADTPRPAAAAPPAMDPVLVFDVTDRNRAETMELLQRASLPALEAGGIARATQLLREPAGAVSALLIGSEPGERGGGLTFEEFRRMDPGGPIIIKNSERF